MNNLLRKSPSKDLFPILYLFLILSSFSIPVTAAQESPSPSRSTDRVILQLKWIHQFNFAGYYAAVEQGYYKEAGLEVTIREGRPGTDFIEEVVSGRADYGVEMPELLIARNNGQPVVALAAIFQHSPQIILARADSGIRSPHNLIGKKVMWRFDSAAELRAMLLNENVSLEQTEFMELSWNINDLIDGKVDALHAYITDQPLLLEKAGTDSAIIQPINYGIDFYGDCLFTSEKEISEHPDRVRAFREASLRGWAYAMENPEEVMDFIRDNYGTKSTREFMRYEFHHINRLMLPDLVEIGHMNPGRWKHIGDTFLKLGMLEPDYSMDGFLYDPNPKDDRTDLIQIVMVLFSLVVIISISAAILMAFNRKLNREVLERTKHLTSEISERKRVEREVSENKAQFEAIFQSITDAVVFTDDQRRIIMVNRAFTEMLGYQPEEVIGHTTQIIYADTENYSKQGKVRFQPNAEIENPIFENVYRRKDGTVFQGETLGTHVKNQDNQMIGFIGIIRDITERKLALEEKEALEEKLQKAEKMKAIGTLAGGIAHDFNNILSAILGNINLALFAENLDDKTKDFLSCAENASLRAKDLTQQLLTFSKGGDPVKEASSLESVIKEAANFILSGGKVACLFEIPDDLWLVDIDRGQISQVIQNMVINASHAMPDGGTIIINCDNIPFVGADILPQGNGGKTVRISIKDSGIGVSADNIDKIFDPFFSSKKEGSGLGLSICHSIVSKHNGGILVDSSPGEGTTFSIYLPASDETEPRPQAQVEDYSISTKARILIMDDEEMVRNIAREMLTQLGHEVIMSGDGKEAVRSYQEAIRSGNPFNLAIMDLTIPGGMGGKEAIKEIHAIDPEAKVIVSSGYSNDPVMANYRDYGFCGAIIKPYRLNELSTVINKVLD